MYTSVTWSEATRSAPAAEAAEAPAGHTPSEEISRTSALNYRGAVHARLTKEMGYWDHRAAELDLQAQAGKTPRMNPDRAELVVGGALVLPVGLLRRATGTGSPPPPAHAIDTTVVERRAVDAVLAAEAALGHSPVEMAPQPSGLRHPLNRRCRPGRFHRGQRTGRRRRHLVVTQNELRFAANIPDGYLLALVEVSPIGAHADQVR
jgi:hypothetical protein